MPLIDVSDLLSDPEIAGQAFTVLRRREIVDASGVSRLTEQRFDAIGSVTPTGDNSLVREEAYQTQSKSVQVITRFRLRGASTAEGKSWQPDVVEWRGGAFEVRTIDDYSDFGGGMIIAQCLSVNLVDTAPDPSCLQVDDGQLFSEDGRFVTLED